MIDTIRIITAERQIENTMETALRSTMSQYSEELASIGLFAFSGDIAEANKEFEKYVKKQFYDAEELSGFQNISAPTFTEASATFDNERNLVDYDVFKHQILESMKYQAPVQMGKELLSLIDLDVSEDEVDEAQKVSESYEEILDLMKKRNEKIDKTLSQIKQYTEIFSEDIPDEVIGNPISDESDEIKVPESVKTFEELLFYHDRYRELLKKRKSEDEEDELKDKEKDEIKNYESGLDNTDFALDYLKNSKDIYENGIKNELLGNGTLDNPEEENSAKWYNDEIGKILDGMDGMDSEILEPLKKMKLDDDFFKNTIEGIDFIKEEFDLDYNSLEERIIANPNLNSFRVAELLDSFYITLDLNMKPLAKKIKEKLSEKVNKFKDNQLKEINKQVTAYKDAKKEMIVDEDEFEQEEDNADTSFGEFWALLNSMKDFSSKLNSDQDNYDDILLIMEEYEGATSGAGEIDEPGRLAFITDAFERFKEFVNFLGGFPGDFRNELYVNEYILANYGTSEPYNLADYHSYLFKNKQAEFITYGYETAGMNYLMFVKDIAMVLFVVNLLELMVKGGFAGPIGFLKAIGQALLNTADNIIDLTTDENKLEWRPMGIGPINMTMPTFLRIFMTMKSTGKTYNNDKLRRLQAVIHHDKDVNLNTSPSYIEGHIKGKVKLWFIPELAKVLPGSVEGNNYIIDKKKVYSY